MRNILTQTLSICATACVLTFVTGCQSNNHGSVQSSTQPAPAATTPPAAVAVAPVPATAAPATSPTAPLTGIVRIKAGSSAPFTDSSGNVWLAEQGFDGGDVIDRDASLEIANTKDAGLYRSEHYSMTSFAISVPNGKYTAKLHFAETFEGVSGPASASSPIMCREKISRILMCLSRPAVPTRPTSKPCRWKSPTGNSPLLSPATWKIQKSTRSNLTRNNELSRLPF